MTNYESKIANHRPLNFLDIQNFCYDQVDKYRLNEFVQTVTFEQIGDNNTWANYNSGVRTIYINKNIKKQFKLLKRYFLYKNFWDKISINANDIFNIEIIQLIFHELWHAKQTEKIYYSTNFEECVLLIVSYMYQSKSDTLYDMYHSHFYHEYDANFNSIRLTCDYLKNKKFNKKVLFLINRINAADLLTSYSLKKYPSPIDFFTFLKKNDFNLTAEEKEPVDMLKKVLVKPDSAFECLKKGYSIQGDVLETLQNIKEGKIETTNIMSELKLAKTK